VCRSPAGARHFYRFLGVHSGTGAHPASYSRRTGDISREKLTEVWSGSLSLHLGPKLWMSGAKPPLLRIIAWWTQKTTVRLHANADGLSQTIPQPITQSYKLSSPPPGQLRQRNGYFGKSSESLKASARWNRNSPPSNTEVKMHGFEPPLTLTPSEWGGSWNAGTMFTVYWQEY